MACAAIVRFCWLRNSYITVATSPGCTCSERSAGLKSHGPRALASNSMVTVRLRSTCVLAGGWRDAAPGPPRSATDSTLTPSASQIALYIGTSA